MAILCAFKLYNFCQHLIDQITGGPNGFQSTFTESKTLYIDKMMIDLMPLQFIDPKKFKTRFPKVCKHSNQCLHYKTYHFFHLIKIGVII